MARAAHIFDQDPAPTRALGMVLGASGVTLPALQVLGDVSGVAGRFNDSNGYGQIASYAGYIYIADTDGNRIQWWTANVVTGALEYVSAQTSIGTLIGGTKPSCLAIDSTTGQIHLASYDFVSTGSWVSVFTASDRGNWASGNRVRRYGSNAGSNTAGAALGGIGITIDASSCIAVSSASPWRVVHWTHTTGDLIAEATQNGPWSAPATDGAGTWWRWQDGGVNAGLYQFTPATLATSGARFDGATANVWRRQRHNTAFGGPCLYRSGRVYSYDLGLVHSWDTSRAAYDQFAWPGALGPSDSFVGNRGQQQGSTSGYAFKGKAGIVTDGNGCEWILQWDNNAENATTNSFITAQPLSTATATWTKTDWSSGTNTLLGLALDGTNLSAEKIKIRLRKNAGAWVTLVAGQFVGAAFTAAIAALGTFTSGDTFTLEISLSGWDRLDGHASLYAVRDKLSPANVYAELQYNDSVADVYVPYASTGFKGKAGGTGAYKGRVAG